MMRNSKLNILVIAVLLLCVAVFFVNHKTMLCLQNIMDIPGRNIVVGDSRIDKQKGWLLIDMKSEDNSTNFVYGMIPCLFLERCSRDSENYYIFLDENRKIAFFESDREFINKLNQLFDTKVNRGGWKIYDVGGFKSFLFYGRDKSDQYAHLVFPDLLLDIWVTANNQEEIEVFLKRLKVEDGLVSLKEPALKTPSTSP